MTATLVAAAPASAAVNISVDFSKPISPRNQLGFMHGSLAHPRFAASNAAATQLAIGLRPGLWRGGDEPWSLDTPIALQAGAIPIHLLSSTWISEAENPNPHCSNKFYHDGQPMPYQDWNLWRQYVKEQATRMALNQPTGDIWVDIWNEPDWPNFWPVRRNDRCYPKSIVDTDGSKWLNTILVSQQVLKQQLGARVKFVGPSVAANLLKWMQKFADFCSTRGCRFDAIGWHLAGGTQGSVDLLPSWMARVRRMLSQDAKWRKVTNGKDTKIWMTEYLPAPVHTLPGALASYLYGLEAANFDAAALASWPDKDSRLSGLINMDGKPTSLYWAAAAYSKGLNSRVRATTSKGAFSVFASKQGTGGKPQLMLGNNTSASGTVAVNLAGLQTLNSGKQMLASFTVLQDSASAVSIEALTMSAPKTYIVSGGSTRLSVTIPKGCAVLVDLVWK